jgi:diaminohydroxyphosphoribosylaminopyrimidine deaminase/5-amino-6-(5-phosphoribosylamino)uracil reductase
VTHRPECTIVVAGPSAAEDRARSLGALGVRVVRASDPPAALRLLRENGIGSLLVEGGGQVAGELIAAGLIDRFHWIQAPLWLGDAGIPAVRGLPSLPLAVAERWRVVERHALGADTLLVLDRR